MSDSIICQRGFTFACRILKLAERMWGRGPASRHIAGQLMKCGTSIGANAEEAQEGQTKPDFIAKLSVSRKEARETLFWLRVAIAIDAVSESEIAWELDEATQLRKMIVRALISARSSPDRGPRQA